MNKDSGMLRCIIIVALVCLFHFLLEEHLWIDKGHGCLHIFPKGISKSQIVLVCSASCVCCM